MTSLQKSLAIILVMLLFFYVLTHIEFHRTEKLSISNKHEHQALKKDKLINLLTPASQINNIELDQQQVPQPVFIDKVSAFRR